MRVIHYKDIVDKVSNACQEVNFDLGSDVFDSFKKSLENEESENGKYVLEQLIENAIIAKEERVPMCQDTGVAVLIVELGQDCHMVGGSLYSAINEGVEKGYKDGFLRHSIVENPITRTTSPTYNSPAVIHIELVPGDQLIMYLSAKGGGSENMSTLKMLKPSDGLQGVKEFILETVRIAGPNACPPLVVGVGIGGNFERCAYLAKKSLFRPVGYRHMSKDISALEEELIIEINKLGIGPQGLGGSTTALDVKIEMEACHIASLPVAINLNCHASRHKKIIM